ncbi:MAG: hypothetical protein ACKO3W_12080, partial [bacterium]
AIGSVEPGGSNGTPLGVVWRQAGATIFVPNGAPDPHAHRPRLADDVIERLLEEKRTARERGIDRLVLEAERTRAPGAPERDRFVARIRWDTEFAPKTTNRQQLAEIGVDVPASDQFPERDTDVHRSLWTIIYGLARLGIFFTETNGISDRAMLEMLAGRVLEDQVSDIPPNGDMSEFIALCPPSHDEPAGSTTVPPDGLRGPFETDEDDDGSWDAWDRQEAKDAERGVRGQSAGQTVSSGCTAPRIVSNDAGSDHAGSEHRVEGGDEAVNDPLLGLPGYPDFPEIERQYPEALRRDHLLPQPYRGGL